MSDYEKLLEAYKSAEGSPDVFTGGETAHLLIHKNSVMGAGTVKGLSLEPAETARGVDLFMRVEKGFRILRPVHLCFGILPEEGVQEINLEAEIEEEAGIEILAHCVFPNAVSVKHLMKGNIRIADGSYYRYREIHFHGEHGGIEVIPEVSVKAGNRSSFKTDFDLIKGRVGKFDLSYDVEVMDDSSLEMTARIHGSGDDAISLDETGRLLGKNSRGLIKSRVAVKDSAKTEIKNELVAAAAGAVGHVDCVEIMQGNARAKAIPIVNVMHEEAKITHEAAIGSVDKKKVETLMARGVSEEEAVNIIIGGMFR